MYRVHSIRKSRGFPGFLLGMALRSTPAGASRGGSGRALVGERRKRAIDLDGTMTRLIVAAAPLVLAACASTGATLGSGVGDAFLEHPPYYAGSERETPLGPASRIGHLPVAYQRGGAQAPIFDPGVTDAMSALLADMTAALDSLQMTHRLVPGGQVSAVTHAATLFPPDVHFSCAPETLPDQDECDLDDSDALGRGGYPMRLAVGRPSVEWTEWMDALLAEQGVDGVIVVTLEVGQYLVRQRGLRGRKVVELGTSHEVGLPWLTSLETPVTVLQLTGALVGPGGKALRIGAEGLLAHRTSMRVSAIGGQEVVTDEDILQLRAARREDLPGAPLVWSVALRTLVTSLLH